MNDSEVITDATLVTDMQMVPDVPGAVDPVEFGSFGSPAGAAPGRGELNAELERLHDVPVELTVEIGRTHMTIGETLGLGPGSIVSLERLAGEPVDLLVNGKRIAYGEVVVIDEEFGLRITELVESPAVAGDSVSREVPGFTASI